MELSTWMLFVVAELLICLSPGPAVIYVTSQGLSQGGAAGLRPSIMANLGIITGSSLCFLASALGLGAMILASHQLFQIIKWVGVLYLMWMGVRMFLSTKNAISTQLPDKGLDRVLARRIYTGGVVVQLANPKNMVFFLAILPPFIDPAGNIAFQILILGLTSHVIEFLVLLFYGALASGAARRVRSTKLALWVNKVAGSLLITIGIGLAFVRRAET